MKSLLLSMCAISIFSTLALFGQSLDWAIPGGGNLNTFHSSINPDSIGNLYLVGAFINTLRVGSGTNSIDVTSNGASDVSITKLDAKGNPVWVKKIGGSNQDMCYSATTDGAGNIYLTGFFTSPIDVDPGPEKQIFTPSPGASDGFIVKLDANGDLRWAKQITGPHSITGTGIASDGFGNCYVSGFLDSAISTTIGSGPTAKTFSTHNYADVFVTKIDANGNISWIRTFGGSGWDYISGMAIDPSGNVAVTGFFSNTVEFDSGAPGTTIQSHGFEDVFIASLSPGGDLNWVRQIGGTLEDRSFGIKTDLEGNIIALGSYYHSVDFDPGVGSHILTAHDDEPYPDAFIVKLNRNGDFVWATQISGPLYNDCYALSTDLSGNIYTTGQYAHDAIYISGKDSSQLPGKGDMTAYVLKLNKDGELVWNSRFSGSGLAFGTGITVDAEGTIYGTGVFQDSLSIDPSHTLTVIPGQKYRDYIVKYSSTSSSVHVQPIPEIPLVYPNPTSGEVTVHLPSMSASCTVLLTDALGRVILNKKYSNCSVLHLQCPETTGIYYLKIISVSGTSLTRIVRQ